MSRAIGTTKLAGYGATVFSEMTRLAHEHQAVNLAQGFPDLDGPLWAKDALARAAREQPGQYTPSPGLLSLREAIASSYHRRFGLSFHPGDEVTVTCGSTQALFTAVLALCDPGDEVILLEPFYDSYRASVRMAGALVRSVALDPVDFSIPEGSLEAAFSSRTRLIVVNTPHNPTGRVLRRDELERIARLCVRYDAICLSDEVYEHLVYEGEHVPMASLEGMQERTLTLSSFSKTFSFTGWRLGWATGAAPLTRAFRLAHQFITFAAPTAMQHAATEVLGCPLSYYDELRNDYLERRDLLVQGLREARLEPVTPQGAFFVCARFAAWGFDDDVRFCTQLVQRVRVAAIPPSAFLDAPEQRVPYARFVFCKQRATLEEGLRRLREAAPLARST